MPSIEEHTRAFGEALAARTGGTLVPLPPSPQPPRRAQWALVLPRGFHAALVIETPSGPLALPADGTTLRDDPDAAVRVLAAHAARDDATALELAMAACARVHRELDHPTWIHPVISGRRLTELYLQGEAFYAHTITLARGAPRAAFDGALEALVSELRAAVLAYRAAEPRARALGETALALVRLLNETVPTPDGSAWSTPPPDLRRIPATIAWGARPPRPIAEIAMPGRLRIGGRALSIARLDLPAMRDAIAERLGQVTRDRLEPGVRYRVIAPLAGARVGDVLVHLRNEWIDDEYPVPVFEGAGGATVRIDDGRVLLQLERYLAFVTD